MAQTSTDPLVLAAAANCFLQCIPVGYQLAIQTYLLATIAGLPTDQAGVQTLVNNATCFMQCIPPSDQIAVQNWILAQLAS